MKNLFKEAHKLTKGIKKEFPEVDYKAQFAICLAYLQEDKVITWNNVDTACEQAVEDLGMTDYYVNNWAKGEYDRSYIELRWYRKGKCKQIISCGYWDNNKNIYVPENRYKKQYDVIKKEYV
ncbi:hypothetical protein FDF69_19680 [Clostridium sporogenes]|uniref:hypothetical protein n=1 Tax=Clostridium TaxID=1485 RepID=UPI0013D3E9C5|nr:MULTISPECIES: hypothetical protein [Clostridium]MBE6058502.1 hypothetical protein [Clostridium sp.]NFF68891.1 hypothetical protein [Clostridium sporogenes]NFG00429.1 hypothetical protein [Clostridium sporogenes]NFG07532.1 hypothetical protein [Clostridium sporogenes]NFG53006.1 hypothetical protein [Clostridium sporogenes]